MLLFAPALMAKSAEGMVKKRLIIPRTSPAQAT